MNCKIIKRIILCFALISLLALNNTKAQAERIKDIVSVKGERSNPLHGVGLIFGLNGTGDNSEVTRRAVASMLRRLNMTFDASQIDAANVATVVVTAELGPFDRVGQKIDITVSTVGAASSLRGGTLLMCPLMGADGRTYAVAQGKVVIGGFGASGKDAKITKGHLTSGGIPNGANVEREELATVVENNEITLLLRNPDHATAEKIAKAICEADKSWKDIAHADDAGTVRIKLPKSVTRKKVNNFLHKLGKLEVEVDQPAKVVINEKTGTIIVGKNVTISTVAITHGNLTITTEEKEYVSQPNPLSNTGTTEKVNRTKIKATEKKGIIRVVAKTLTVTQLARALNAMGLTPTDMISIFKALKAAGALQAELVIR